MGKPATELHGAGLASYNTLTLAEGGFVRPCGCQKVWQRVARSFYEMQHNRCLWSQTCCAATIPNYTRVSRHQIVGIYSWDYYSSIRLTVLLLIHPIHADLRLCRLSRALLWPFVKPILLPLSMAAPPRSFLRGQRGVGPAFPPSDAAT